MLKARCVLIYLAQMQESGAQGAATGMQARVESVVKLTWRRRISRSKMWA